MDAKIGITIVILPDKQQVELPDEHADKDETLRESLEMYVPEIRNAELKRSIKEGQKYVEVIKKAGTKGNERTYDEPDADALETLWASSMFGKF